MKTFKVWIARSHIETAVVEVRAESEKEAEAKVYLTRAQHTYKPDNRPVHYRIYDSGN